MPGLVHSPMGPWQRQEVKPYDHYGPGGPSTSPPAIAISGWVWTTWSPEASSTVLAEPQAAEAFTIKPWCRRRPTSAGRMSPARNLPARVLSPEQYYLPSYLRTWADETASAIQTGPGGGDR